MALRHATSGEIVRIEALDPGTANVPSTAIVRDDHIEVMRLVLPAGKTVAEHGVDGPITLHCLQGAVEVRAHNETKLLRAGELMYLAGAVAHGLHAVEDTSLLATVVRLQTT